MTTRGQEAEPMPELEPDLERARQTAQVAHRLVVRLRAMDLPPRLAEAADRLGTDLGDIWGASKALEAHLEALLSSDGAPWEELADRLADIRDGLDHMAWHARRARSTLGRLARHAYRRAVQEGGQR